MTDLTDSAQLLLRVPTCDEERSQLNHPWAACRTAPLNHGRPAAVVEVPPLPGSAELFLSALVGIGAWHLARQSRDVRLGGLPEWYQTCEPVQVRHMVAFDVRFVTGPLPPIYVAVRPARIWRVRIRTDDQQFCSEWSGSVVGSRAPPAGHTQHG